MHALRLPYAYLKYIRYKYGIGSVLYFSGEGLYNAPVHTNVHARTHTHIHWHDHMAKRQIYPNICVCKYCCLVCIFFERKLRSMLNPRIILFGLIITIYISIFRVHFDPRKPFMTWIQVIKGQVGLDVLMKEGYMWTAGFQGSSVGNRLKWYAVASTLPWPWCKIITIKVIVVSNNSHIQMIHNNYNQLRNLLH